MKTADTRCTTVTGRKNTDGTTQDNKRGLKTVFVSTVLAASFEIASESFAVVSCSPLLGNLRKNVSKCFKPVGEYAAHMSKEVDRKRLISTLVV